MKERFRNSGFSGRISLSWGWRRTCSSGGKRESCGANGRTWYISPDAWPCAAGEESWWLERPWKDKRTFSAKVRMLRDLLPLQRWQGISPLPLLRYSASPRLPGCALPEEPFFLGLSFPDPFEAARIFPWPSFDSISSSTREQKNCSIWRRSWAFPLAPSHGTALG